MTFKIFSKRGIQKPALKKNDALHAYVYIHHHEIEAQQK